MARRRDLGEEERVLWRKVTDSVTPLAASLRPRRRSSPRKPAEEGLAEPVHDDAAVSAPAASAKPLKPQEKREKKTRERPVPPPYVPPVDRPKPALKPLVPIDARTRRKLSRGSLEIEARIDLHGLTQSEAFPVLVGFLRRCQSDGHRLVIVITGKGRTSSDGLIFDARERGILRRLVPHWLALPEFRMLVAGYEEAGPTHGGAGALYVRLRKRAQLSSE